VRVKIQPKVSCGGQILVYSGGMDRPASKPIWWRATHNGVAVCYCRHQFWFGANQIARRYHPEEELVLTPMRHEPDQAGDRDYLPAIRPE
jgi:hypothetical protein